jgi:hypothetical protein
MSLLAEHAFLIVKRHDKVTNIPPNSDSTYTLLQILFNTTVKQKALP